MAVEIKICLGTMCYVAGNSDIKNIKNILEEKYGNKIKIVKTACMGLCSNEWKTHNAPHVKINDKVLSNCTLEKIFEIIDEII